MALIPRFEHFKAVGIGAASGAVVLALIITGFTFGGGTPAPSSSNTTSDTPVASSTPSATATTAVCSATKQATDTRLGDLHAAVVDAKTGQLLFDRQADVPAATASLLKTLTATAALQVLGPNYRVDTKVLRDPTDPGTIILVGGGDITLSRLAPGKDSVYKGAAHLSDLAVQVNQAMGATPITKIIADDSLFTGDNWLPSWERTEQTIGYMSEVSALQVDGDRNDATKETSPRSTDPTTRAATWFKKALGSSAANATIELGTAPAGATQIGKVSSAPISSWITHMLQVSDNTQAEALARLVSLQQGFDGSFQSIDASDKKALKDAGADATGSTIIDGSGLSNLNAVSPLYITKLMNVLLNAQGDIKGVRDGLPVSGETGSLAARFTGKNKDAVGKVFAKTGWIKHGYSLGGFIYAKDGSTLLFAVYALGPTVQDSAKAAIDNLVSQFYRCGLALSDQ